MQTFLPYKSFYKSAMALDKKRCWKQVVETSQIIDVLDGRKTGWENHPAVKMWVGHTDSLKAYFNVFLKICKNKHGINTKYTFITDMNVFRAINDKPWWLGKIKFHKAMRARLIEKDKEFYLPKFPKDNGFNSGLYFWPDMETKTFKIIKPKK